LFGLLHVLTGGVILALNNGLVLGLIAGLFGGIVGAVRKVTLIEPSNLTWEKLKISMRFGLYSGFFVTLLFVLLTLLTLNLTGVSDLEDGPILLLLLPVVQLLIGLILGLFFGLIFQPESESDLPKLTITRIPNQGVKHSFKNALTVALSVWLIAALIAGLFVGLSYDLLDGILYGLLLGLLFGLIGGIVGGGDAVFKHYILRLILCWRGNIPWRYAHFLDHAADLIFLRKVGGGYIFTHRLLMEHFAQLHDEATDNTLPPS
jgi:hypothetical protein